MGQYLLNIGIVIDRLLNTILLGHPSDTLSQRLGRAKCEGKMLMLSGAIDSVALLLFGEANHCLNSLSGKSMGRELWCLGGSRDLIKVED